jgi:hypothetical protein
MRPRRSRSQQREIYGSPGSFAATDRDHDRDNDRDKAHRVRDKDHDRDDEHHQQPDNPPRTVTTTTTTATTTTTTSIAATATQTIAAGLAGSAFTDETAGVPGGGQVGCNYQLHPAGSSAWRATSPHREFLAMHPIPR